MTSDKTYNGIEFEYQKILDNLRDISVIAKSFITPESISVLTHCGTVLENIRNSTSSNTQYWEIRQSWPVRTIDSEGEYRASAKGRGRAVYAKFSFRWGIKNSSGNGGRRTFYLVDEATTSMQVFDKKTLNMVALWQMEVGDAQSPGCHFHASMTERCDRSEIDNPVEEPTDRDDFENEKLFPEWLKVPRLPSLIVTPFDALEFLLCELFQTRWPEAVSQNYHHVTSWSKSQNDRLCKLLSWKLKVLQESQNGGWSALKRAKPTNAQMFLSL